jgi:hypothetical protein
VLNLLFFTIFALSAQNGGHVGFAKLHNTSISNFQKVAKTKRESQLGEEEDKEIKSKATLEKGKEKEN